MAFSPKEQEIIRYGLQSGKSREEVEAAIARSRVGVTTTQPQVQPEKQGFLSGIKQDFTTRTENAANAQIEALEGKRTDASAALRTVGEGARFAGDIALRSLSAVTPDPIEDLAQAGIERVAQTGPVQAGIEKYQSLKSQYPETIGALEDIGAIGSAFLAPGAANVTTKGVIKVAERSAKALGGITEKGTAGIKAATSKALDPASIMQRVARVSKSKQAAFQERAGESVGQYLVKRGIFGDIDEITGQLYTRFEKSKGEVDKAFASLPGTYKNTAVGSALKELAKREQSVSTPGALSKDFGRIRELLKKHNGGGLDMSEINEVKRLYERNVKLDYLRENTPDKIARANNIDTAIREWQQTTASQLGFKNIQELNRETFLAKQLLDDLGIEYAGSAGNNAISLTDWIVLAGGDPTAVGGFLAKKALSSKGIMSKVAQILTRRDPMGDPKATMTTPTIDNYLNFLKKTTQPTIDIDTTIKDSVKNMQPGLSTKAVRLHPEDSAILEKFIDAVRLGDSPEAPDMKEWEWLEAERILQRVGNYPDDLNKQANVAEDILTGKLDASVLYRTGRNFAE